MSDQEIDFDLFLQNQGYNHLQAVPILFDAYYAHPGIWLTRLPLDFPCY